MSAPEGKRKYCHCGGAVSRASGPGGGREQGPLHPDPAGTARRLLLGGNRIHSGRAKCRCRASITGVWGPAARTATPTWRYETQRATSRPGSRGCPWLSHGHGGRPPLTLIHSFIRPASATGLFAQVRGYWLQEAALGPCAGPLGVGWPGVFGKELQREGGPSLGRVSSKPVCSLQPLAGSLVQSCTYLSSLPPFIGPHHSKVHLSIHPSIQTSVRRALAVSRASPGAAHRSSLSRDLKWDTHSAFHLPGALCRGRVPGDPSPLLRPCRCHLAPVARVPLWVEPSEARHPRGGLVQPLLGLLDPRCLRPALPGPGDALRPLPGPAPCPARICALEPNRKETRTPLSSSLPAPRPPAPPHGSGLVRPVTVTTSPGDAGGLGFGTAAEV
ncbi:uncharacterized protein [Oryctolagus cuniculus]|uniref:uncharacterized protein n=1 Tax=Oryctolagus cuniculus TaxID=9986 RepID=UPI003879B11C